MPASWDVSEFQVEGIGRQILPRLWSTSKTVEARVFEDVSQTVFDREMSVFVDKLLCHVLVIVWQWQRPSNKASLWYTVGKTP
jgi:hypothetical protein